MQTIQSIAYKIGCNTSKMLQMNNELSSISCELDAISWLYYKSMTHFKKKINARSLYLHCSFHFLVSTLIKFYFNGIQVTSNWTKKGNKIILTDCLKYLLQSVNSFCNVLTRNNVCQVKTNKMVFAPDWYLSTHQDRFHGLFSCGKV